VGQTVVTRFHQPPPSGGTLSTLSHDRHLIHFGFEDFGGKGREVAAKVKITEDVDRWLRQIGYYADRDMALRKARGDVLGDMIAATYHADGKFFVAELNAPAPVAEQPPLLPEPDDDPAEDGADLGDDEAEETPAYLRRLAGGGEASAASPAPAAPTPAAPAPDEPETLPPMLAIVLVEVAHKIGVEGVQRGEDTWAAAILADYYKDDRGQKLVHRRMLQFLPHGHLTMVGLTKAGREYLERTEGMTFTAGRTTVPLFKLVGCQEASLGSVPSGRLYSTAWLEKPAPAVAPAPAEPPAAQPHPQSEASQAEARPDEDAEDDAAWEAAAPAEPTHAVRALANLIAATDQARSLLNTLCMKSKPPKRDDVDPTIRLIDAALDFARATLAQAGQPLSQEDAEA
jgi:hypothetical protein